MEIYGRGKIMEAAHGCRRNLNIRGLDALDLRTCMDDGTPWDFNNPEHRRRARHLVETLRPTWLIGSPPCTAYTRLNWNWNYPKMDPQTVQAKIEEGRRHLHFIIGLYHLQLEQGRHFLHEHPAGAKSWDDEWMVQLLQHPRVKTIISDQCEYGLVTRDDHGHLVPAKKPTRWATTSDQMISRLSKRCSGQHQHQPLLGGRAADAAFYPLPLITEILRGIRDTTDFEHRESDTPPIEISRAMARAAMIHDDEPSLLANLQEQQLRRSNPRRTTTFR